MFDLEQSIAEWRAQMTAAGIAPAPLEELESHLREDFRALVSVDQSDFEAFRQAVSRVGDPRSVVGEFKKSKSVSSIKIGLWLWVGILFFIIGAPPPTRLSNGLLIYGHFISLTIGYLTAFFSGGFGIYLVCRRFHGLSPGRGQELASGIILFNRLAAGFVTAGLLLGLLWNKQTHLEWVTNDPRQFGTFIVAAWLIASTLVQWFGEINGRSAALLSIAGNMIVGIAWFGGIVLAHGHAMAGYWPLDVLVCAHLFFFVMEIVPESKTTEVSI